VSFLSTLKERRLPQFVAAYAAGGWVILQLVDQLVDRGVAPDALYPTALVVFICGAPAAIILSWFHGAPGSQTFRPLEISLLGTLGVITVAASAWVWQATSESEPASTLAAVDLPPSEDPRRIAVLYFEARGDDDVQFLASGITETLIDELSAVQVLHVISRNGVAPFRGKNVAPDSVGRALEVGTIVDGVIAASSDRVRVDVSLINATTGRQYGDVELERPRAELFDLQDELATEVALQLRSKLGPEVELRQRQAETQVVEAWELLQRAGLIAEEAAELAATGDREAADERLARADSVLAAATELEPSWVRPVIDRGWLAYRGSRMFGFDRVAADERISRGLEFANGALAAAPAEPSALELRGTLNYWRYLLNLGGGPEEAERLRSDAETDLRAAVEADGQRASAWSSLSHLLINKGNVSEGKLAAMRSYERDPYLQNAHLTVWRLFTTSLNLEDPIEARKWCDEGQRRFPDEYRFQECELLYQSMRGVQPEVAQAWRAFEGLVAASPSERSDFNEQKGLLYMAMVLAQADLPDSAAAVADRARTSPDVDPVRELAYYEAIVRSWLGDLDEGIRLLGVFLAANPGRIQAFAEDDSWWLEELRKDPRYASLVAG
jgi:serine/threonine-protein kinase